MEMEISSEKQTLCIFMVYWCSIVQRTRQYFYAAKINQGGHDKGLWSITVWPPDSVCWLVGVSWVSMGAVLGRVPRAGAGGARGQVSRCSGRHAVPRLTGPLASGGSGHSAALEPPTASHQPPSSDTRPLINRQLRPADHQSQCHTVTHRWRLCK